MKSHSPLPWGYCYDGSSDWSIGPADDPQENPACGVWSKDDAKALADCKLICTAVNNHDRLLAFVRKVAEAKSCNCHTNLEEAQQLIAGIESEVRIAKPEGE